MQRNRSFPESVVELFTSFSSSEGVIDTQWQLDSGIVSLLKVTSL